MPDSKVLAYDPRNNFEVKVSDVEYQQVEGEICLARIYQPNARGPFPAVLDVHGGAWNRGDRTRGEYEDQQLATSGLVVVAIDFRLAPKYPYPAQVVDTNYATRWLKASAKEFNIDRRYIGMLGVSSGGHTAMLSAMRPHDPCYAILPLDRKPAFDATVGWVIALSPVLDSHARYIYAKDASMERLVTATEAYFLTEETMRNGNPQGLLDSNAKIELPPILIIYGTSDMNVPLSIPERFTSSYRASGGEVDLELFAGMPHVFTHQDHSSPETKRAIDIMKAWIARKVTATS